MTTTTNPILHVTDQGDWFEVEAAEPITFVIFGVSNDSYMDDLCIDEYPEHCCDFFDEDSGTWCDATLRVWRDHIDQGITAMAMHGHDEDELLVVCCDHKDGLRTDDGQRWCIGPRDIGRLMDSIRETYRNEWLKP